MFVGKAENVYGINILSLELDFYSFKITLKNLVVRQIRELYSYQIIRKNIVY